VKLKSYCTLSDELLIHNFSLSDVFLSDELLIHAFTGEKVAIDPGNKTKSSDGPNWCINASLSKILAGLNGKIASSSTLWNSNLLSTYCKQPNA
jgi:hypothetical protein